MAMNYSRQVGPVFFFILSSLFFLVSCSAPRLPIFIQDVWISEPPIVGKIVRLGIRVKSIGVEEKIRVTVNFPETIAVIESPMRWEFGLNDKEEKELFSDICVLESGTWLIDVGISSLYEDGEMKYGDLRAICVISSTSQ